MEFDPRIGERYDVGGVAAYWEPHLESDWTQRLRRARGEDPSRCCQPTGSTNAVIHNVSVSGAGVVAPAESGAVPDTTVTVRLGPDASFEAVIRRVLPAEEIGRAYFGVEFTSTTPGFGTWLDSVMESSRARQNL